MKLLLFTVVVCCLASGAVRAQDACPDGSQAIQRLSTCLSTFNRLTDFSTSFNAIEINTYCRSSFKSVEIQCAERIFTACRASSAIAREVLEKAFNFDSIRQSVEILCNNTAVFASQQNCIGRVENSVTSCIVTAFQSYNRKLDSLKFLAFFLGIEWFTRRAYEELCTYHEKVNDCQRPYGINCGTEIGDVFHDLWTAAIPPVCSKPVVILP